MTVQLPTMPDGIAKLPRDERGYPIPWFVARLPDGTPEFRCTDHGKFQLAVKFNLCWVCGEEITQAHLSSYVVGPMCAVNRTSAEPPSHHWCALFSVKACPFLSMPKAHRREANMPDTATTPAGMGIMRNPGVSLIWSTGHPIKPFGDGRGGVLFYLPNFCMLEWFAEGRQATRSEVLESMQTGIPILREVADEHDGPAGRAELERKYQTALMLVPHG